MNGYESLVWIKDDKGHELCCEAKAIREEFADGDRLDDKELVACMDVNELVGTERW